ncbi:copper homeostasis protein CutC [Arthrobacter sp. AZCC_0090]|uniref:copper homeostasis protein CutC n=1 Tax=Arthrobacter sp. AZCC_0090 TaxID=2735881 RepID=UPI00161D7B4D|nr:copper homeostasis protein CutC [Arthrobacter sp. AZCC_0090]MBB6406901.1 copper homeostasis protein [Arthrobacter sp. AZCC_0090]
MKIEVCVQDLDGVRCAIEAGADRVELCSALDTGGLTPSAGLVEAAVELARDAGRRDFVQVLIRSRTGGFVYSRCEIDVMRRDIRHLLAAGADGVVIGLLTASGDVDVAGSEALVDAADGNFVTYHRAVDAAREPLQAVADAARLGARRILTSGAAQAAGDGVDMLKLMVAALPEGVAVMAGGGVTEESVPGLLATGIQAIHFSGRKLTVDSAPSGPGGGDGIRSVTHPAIVERLVRTVRSAEAVMRTR